MKIVLKNSRKAKKLCTGRHTRFKIFIYILATYFHATIKEIGLFSFSNDEYRFLKNDANRVLFTFSFPCIDREIIVLESKFRNGDFDGFTRYEDS